jgi:hypothetical protein
VSEECGVVFVMDIPYAQLKKGIGTRVAGSFHCWKKRGSYGMVKAQGC